MSTHQNVATLQVEEMEKRMAPMSLASQSIGLDLDPVSTDPPTCTEPPEGGRDPQRPFETIG